MGTNSMEICIKKRAPVSIKREKAHGGSIFFGRALVDKNLI